MSIQQISVFLENRPGQLAEVAGVLARANVDIRAISIAETADYGLVRMIVDDCHRASTALVEHGNILSITPVWAVEVPDCPGGLAGMLEVLAKHHVDVEYMYSLFTHRDGCAYMVLRITDAAALKNALAGTDIRIVDANTLGLI